VPHRFDASIIAMLFRNVPTQKQGPLTQIVGLLAFWVICILAFKEFGDFSVGQLYATIDGRGGFGTSTIIVIGSLFGWLPLAIRIHRAISDSFASDPDAN